MENKGDTSEFFAVEPDRFDKMTRLVGVSGDFLRAHPIMLDPDKLGLSEGEERVLGRWRFENPHWPELDVESGGCLREVVGEWQRNLVEVNLAVGVSRMDRELCQDVFASVMGREGSSEDLAKLGLPLNRVVFYGQAADGENKRGLLFFDNRAADRCGAQKFTCCHRTD